VINPPTTPQGPVSTSRYDANTPIQGTATPVTGNAAKEATQIKTEQIICRGGPSFNFGIGNPDLHEQDLEAVGHGLSFGNQKYKRIPHGLAIVMQLNFLPAMDEAGQRLAAGENAEGLIRPATCSFLHRGLMADDPVGIRFETLRPVGRTSRDAPSPPPKSAERAMAAVSGRADAQTIPDYLSFPEHYWTFHVYKRPYGNFVAVKHGPWTRKADIRIAGTAGNIGGGNITVARLGSIDVFPGLNSVTFNFTARPNATPVVQVGTEPPAMQPNGLATLNGGRSTAARDAKNSNDTVTRYTAERQRLNQGKEYYYLITVPGEGADRTQQASGKFTTLAQTVTVRYSTIRVLRLGDDDDLHFTFWVNPGEGEQTRRKVDVPGVDSGGNHWKEGGLYRLDKELVITGDANRLRLLVEGSFSDDGIYSCFNEVPFAEGPRYFENAQPSAGKCDHVNVAKAEYLLSMPELAGGNRNLPFVMRATLGRHGAQLAFDVTGSIEVIRPPVRAQTAAR
jgi:hypothetical protein